MRQIVALFAVRLTVRIGYSEKHSIPALTTVDILLCLFIA